MGKYCEVNGSWCPCGKVGDDILRCKKRLSPERMSEVMLETSKEFGKMVDNLADQAIQARRRLN